MLCSGSLKFFGSVERYICFSCIEELICIFAIDVATLALLIGTVGTTFTDSFIKLNAEPIKTLHDVFFSTGHKPTAVGVLDAENHVASMLAGEEIVEKRSADTSNVEGACWGGSESYSGFHLFIILNFELFYN